MTFHLLGLFLLLGTVFQAGCSLSSSYSSARITDVHYYVQILCVPGVKLGWPGLHDFCLYLLSQVPGPDLFNF